VPLGDLARSSRRDESGAVAVEFALLVPLLLLLVLGTIQYGSYFYSSQAGSDIARDAARRAAVGDPVSCADFKDAVQAGIDGVAGHGSTTYIKRTYARRPAGRTGDLLPGDEVTVQLQFQAFDMNLPFVPVPNDSRISATVKVRLEYVPEQPEECP
jgi:Flp pilus assembly protein TadG